MQDHERRSDLRVPTIGLAYVTVQDGRTVECVPKDVSAGGGSFVLSQADAPRGLFWKGARVKIELLRRKKFHAFSAEAAVIHVDESGPVEFGVRWELDELGAVRFGDYLRGEASHAGVKADDVGSPRASRSHRAITERDLPPRRAEPAAPGKPSVAFAWWLVLGVLLGGVVAFALLR
jgi:hypothetical protein